MKIAFVGYRQWAYRIFENLTNYSKSYEFEIVDPAEAEVILYYGWSWKIPKSVYSKKLCLVMHLSPLPMYRGGSPIQNQIMNGEKKSAVSILKVEEKIDTGDIYGQAPFSLEGSMNEIFDRIVEVGTKTTLRVIYEISKGLIKPQKQDEESATYFKRRKPEDSELPMAFLGILTAREVYDFVRALGDPYPNAFIKCGDGKKLYLKEVYYER
jgi:methionyl-tRNA formyltransferase